MAFLRTLFWIVVTVIVVIFSIHNWVPVTVDLFGDLKADVKLPMLLLAAFLLGFAPLYLWHRALLWRDRRRAAATTLPVAAPVPFADPADPGIAPARAD